MGRAILLHPERMGPVLNEAIFICGNEAIANITFRMETLLVAGPVVRMVFMNSKLPKRKVGVNYLVKLKDVMSGTF
jgi:hypothetical protein